MKLHGTWNDYVSAEQYEAHLETWRNLMFKNLFGELKRKKYGKYVFYPFGEILFRQLGLTRPAIWMMTLNQPRQSETSVGLAHSGLVVQCGQDL